MAEPPQLSEITLPEEKSVIYFVTLCVKGRRKVLADAKVFDAIKTAIQQLRRWNVLAAVIMPDHAHFIVGPREERGFSVAEAKAAREAFISSATTIAMPVVEIDGAPIANGHPGSMTLSLRQAFFDIAEKSPA